MPVRKSDTRSIGNKGEDYAIELLQKKGYRILQRNYYTKVGEIDIIAKEGDILVFVEVKLRKSKKFGVPEAAVTQRKLNRIKRAGQYYCQENKLTNIKMRIDVVSILLDNNKVVSSIIKVI